MRRVCRRPGVRLPTSAASCTGRRVESEGVPPPPPLGRGLGHVGGAPGPSRPASARPPELTTSRSRGRLQARTIEMSPGSRREGGAGLGGGGRRLGGNASASDTAPRVGGQQATIGVAAATTCWRAHEPRGGSQHIRIDQHLRTGRTSLACSFCMKQLPLTHISPLGARLKLSGVYGCLRGGEWAWTPPQSRWQTHPTPS